MCTVPLHMQEIFGQQTCGCEAGVLKVRAVTVRCLSLACAPDVVAIVFSQFVSGAQIHAFICFLICLRE